MKKKYYLYRLFFVIASVLISSFMMNGCTSSKHLFKQKEELKYPEWPGLDEKIEQMNTIYISAKRQHPEQKDIQLSQLNIKEDDIKWHLLIKFKDGVKAEKKNELIKILKNESGAKLPKDFKFVVYKDIENYLYIKLENIDDLRKLFVFLDNIHSDIIPMHSIEINPLLKVSIYHYYPLSIGAIFIEFKKTTIKEEFEKFAKTHSLIIAEKFNNNKNEYFFKLPENVDIVSIYNKLIESKIVRYVYFSMPVFGSFGSG